MLLNKLQQLGEIKENELLKNHTTFKIGGPARYFFIAKSSESLLEAVKLCDKLNLKYFILGGGSNSLVADKGFDGLVIKVRSDKFLVADNADGLTDSADNWGLVSCDSGLSVGRLIGLAAQKGFVGIEFMAGIPGTVGGAICGNAGAYGRSLGEMVTEVEVYKDGQIKKLTKEQMGYSYRMSIVKKEGGVILSVTLGLPKGDTKKSAQEILKIIRERNAKLPIEPSSGSIFKNVEINQIENLPKLLKGLDITEEEFRQDVKYKLPVGYILEKMNLKGFAIGGAKICDKHGNIIINFNNATADNVATLISVIKRKVRDSIGIQLQEEVCYVGF